MLSVHLILFMLISIKYNVLNLTKQPWISDYNVCLYILLEICFRGACPKTKFHRNTTYNKIRITIDNLFHVKKLEVYEQIHNANPW